MKNVFIILLMFVFETIYSQPDAFNYNSDTVSIESIVFNNIKELTTYKILNEDTVERTIIKYDNKNKTISYYINNDYQNRGLYGAYFEISILLNDNNLPKEKTVLHYTSQEKNGAKIQLKEIDKQITKYYYNYNIKVYGFSPKLISTINKKDIRNCRVEVYNYNSNNNLLFMFSSDDTLHSRSCTSYIYDNEYKVNLKEQGKARIRFEYNNINQLVKVYDTIVNYYFTYDKQGKLSTKIISGKYYNRETQYLYNKQGYLSRKVIMVSETESIKFVYKYKFYPQISNNL